VTPIALSDIGSFNIGFVGVDRSRQGMSLELDLIIMVLFIDDMTDVLKPSRWIIRGANDIIYIYNHLRLRWKETYIPLQSK